MKKKTTANAISIVFFIDPYGYFKIINVFQFHAVMIMMCIIPFTYIFTSVSIHFAILLVKIGNHAKKIKIFISIFGFFLCTISVSIFLAYMTRLALYDVPSSNLLLAAKIMSSAVFGFEILVFIARCIYIFLKLLHITVDSNNYERRKVQYYKSLFWITIISIGYLLTFVASLASIPKSMSTPSNNLNVICILFFGTFLSSFGLLFIFKPFKNVKIRSIVDTPRSHINKNSSMSRGGGKIEMMD